MKNCLSLMCLMILSIPFFIAYAEEKPETSDEVTQELEIKESVVESINLIEPIITGLAIIIAAIFGAFIGARTVRWQIGRQHRDNLELERQSMREKLRLEIYKEISEKIKISSTLLVKSTTYIIGIPMAFTTRLTQKTTFKDFHFEPPPVEHRADTIAKKYSDASNLIIDMIQILEQFEIAIPNFTEFRRALTKKSDLIRDEFFKFQVEAIKFLPQDVPEDQVQKVGSKIIVPKLPDEKQIKTLERLAQNYQNACIGFLGVIKDLSIESPNNLLGSLFDYKLPPRKPGDPNVQVISTDTEKITERPKGNLV